MTLYKRKVNCSLDLSAMEEKHGESDPLLTDQEKAVVPTQRRKEEKGFSWLKVCMQFK